MPRKIKRQDLEQQAAALLFDAYSFTAEKRLDRIEEAVRALAQLVDEDDEGAAVELCQRVTHALANISNILHTPAHPTTA